MSVNDMRDEFRSAEVDAGAACSSTVGPYGSLSVSVRRSGGWTVVPIGGEMDLRVMPLIRERVSATDLHLVFELRQVTFMDACGLDLLLRSQRGALRAGGCVRLVAPSRKVRRVLMLTGATREFTTFDSVDEAVAAPSPEA